jgi:hypothetical protein
MPELFLPCSSPTVRGFCKIVVVHCAGHRKSKVEYVVGRQLMPSRPHRSLANQYVDVQSAKELAGIRKDCSREKKARPMIYKAARRMNKEGELK